MNAPRSLRGPIVVSLLVGLVLALPALLPRDALANVFFDDAFYYFGIARHLVTDRRFTFDGIHTTSGFQPLWLLLITPLFGLFRGAEAPLRAVILLQATLTAYAASLIFERLERRVGRSAAAVAALSVVALPGLHLVVDSGMESALLLLLLVLIWREYSRLDADSRLTRLGALCALAFLTRPESIVAPLLLALALALRRRLDVRRGLQLATPIAIAIVADVGLNLILCGSPIPMSGLIKSNRELAAQLGAGTLPQRLFFSLPAYPLAWAIVGPNERLALWLAWSLVFGAVTFALVFRRRLMALVDRAGVRAPLAICMAFWLVQTSILQLSAPWYGVWLVLATALLSGALLASIRWSQLVAAAFVIATLANGFIHARRSWTASRLMETQVIDAALWTRTQLRPGEAVGSWNAGLFGYYCDCAVVSLDGLVNDESFYREVILAKNLPAYLRREKIHWLADEILRADSFARPMFGITTRQLEKQSMILVKSFCTPGDGNCGGFGVWRPGD